MSAPHSAQNRPGSSNDARHRGHTNFCAGVDIAAVEHSTAVLFDVLDQQGACSPPLPREAGPFTTGDRVASRGSVRWLSLNATMAI
jgi:hypothetical protein